MARTPLSTRYSELVAPVVLSCLGYLVGVWLLASAVVAVGLGLAILAGFLEGTAAGIALSTALDVAIHHHLTRDAIELGIVGSVVAVAGIAVYFVSAYTLEFVESVARRVRRLS